MVEYLNIDRRSVALQQKLKVTITFNHIKRLNEEKVILLSEMNSYIKYFLHMLEQLDRDAEGTCMTQ